MKYLAPGEKNPWELWKRQAKALASVEKTPELQDKWEAAFFEALKNFKFVLIVIMLLCLVLVSLFQN